MKCDLIKIQTCLDNSSDNVEWRITNLSNFSWILGFNNVSFIVKSCDAETKENKRITKSFK